MFFRRSLQLLGESHTLGECALFSNSAREKLTNVPSLQEFMRQRTGQESSGPDTGAMTPVKDGAHPHGRNVFIETYGCQMNSSDSEIVMGILGQQDYTTVAKPDQADVILVNTCAIREGAEQRIWGRLGVFKGLKSVSKQQGREAPIVGVLGCMAERLKTKLLETDRLVDIVAGPDAYRDLPRLIDIVRGIPDASALDHLDAASPLLSPASLDRRATGAAAGPRSSPGPARAQPAKPRRPQAINVQLSAEETYADVAPVRSAGKASAYLSIMRGCSNLCSFCIVPFTRGRERSRPLPSILEEVKQLAGAGVKEITLLGQNVNSYADRSHLGGGDPPRAATSGQASPTDPFGAYARGFTSVYKPDRSGARSFAELLLRCSEVDPEVRLRFTSPHPKDFHDDVLRAVQSRPNICKQLHMPAQSGSTAVLERMRRGYTREHYLELVDRIRAAIPGVALSTDMIAGFCGESESDHAASVDLLHRVRFDNAFLFAYSRREKTHAARHYEDDVTEEVKLRRLRELMATFKAGFEAGQMEEVGRRHLVLVEGTSPKSEAEMIGKTDTGKKVIVPRRISGAGPGEWDVELRAGDYVAVVVERVKAGVTLQGRPITRTTLTDFYRSMGMEEARVL